MHRRILHVFLYRYRIFHVDKKMGFFVTCAWSLFPRPPITQVGRRGYPGSKPLMAKSLLPCPHYWLMTKYERWSWRKSWFLYFRPFWHRSLVFAMRHFQFTAAPVHLPRCYGRDAGVPSNHEVNSWPTRESDKPFRSELFFLLRIDSHQ